MATRFWFVVYNLIFLPLLSGTVKILAPFSRNIKDSLEKREGLWERLENAVSNRDWQKPLLWFHVASAGELLQAQPLIDRCSAQGSECVLTYSSVNAFRWLQRPGQKEILNLLAVEFLPLDLICNVRRLLGLLQPSRLIWVSYDLWPNLVWEAHRQKIPQSLVSGIVHASSLRTISFAGRSFFRTLYKCLEHILTVSEADRQRVLSAFPEHTCVEVMGDTRCDSVLERRDNLQVPKLPADAENKLVFIAGSTWPPDEKCVFPGLKDALESHPDLFLIIAPHEPTEDHLSNAENYFAGIPMSRWSNMSSDSEQLRIILVDSVGILAALYHHAQMAYVGGAFTTGVHNVLEPAVMGATISFGPKHSNSMESLQMLEKGLAACVKDADEFRGWLFNLLDDRKRCRELGKQSREYVERQAGASERCFPLLVS